MKKQLNLQLPNGGSVRVHERKGKRLVSFRQDNDTNRRKLEGITLTIDEWCTLRDSIPIIDEAVLHYQRATPKCSGTIKFDGTNFCAWARELMFLLKYLKIDYVLSDHCPNAVLGPESSSTGAARSKADKPNWTSDDRACHHIILNSLSDSIFRQYSERTISAGELWKELSTPFQYRTKRSLVKKYEEFRMVEGRPLSEQVEELNTIAKSIISAGMPIDEEFHHSFILSKLPSSMELVHEEHLPSVELLNRLRVEEQLRPQQNSHTTGASPKQRGQGTAVDHPLKIVLKASKRVSKASIMEEPKSDLPLKKRRLMDV